MPYTSETKQAINPYVFTGINALAAATSAASHLFIFHPFDTWAKRLQNGQPAFGSSPYSGMGAAGALKLSHRMIKYGGESFIREKLSAALPTQNPVLLRCFSGGLIGGVEALMTTPLDTLKAKKQSGLYNTKNYMQLWKEEKPRRFKPLKITLARNSLGSAAFFSADSALRHYVFHLNDQDTLTLPQKIVNSAICPTVGTLVSYPADLLKTRIQIDPSLPQAFTLLKKTLVEEGAKALYKGVGVKALSTLPSGIAGYLFFQVIRDGLQNTYLSRQSRDDANAAVKASCVGEKPLNLPVIHRHTKQCANQDEVNKKCLNK